MAMCHEYILTYTWPIKWLTITECPEAFTRLVAAATWRSIANPQVNTVVCKRQQTLYHALLLRLECAFRRNVPRGCLWVHTVRKHFKMCVIDCLEVFILWSYCSAFRSDTLNSNILCLKEKKHKRNGSEFELLLSFVHYTMAIHMLLSIEVRSNFQRNTFLYCIFDLRTIKIYYVSRSWITYVNAVSRMLWISYPKLRC